MSGRNIVAALDDLFAADLNECDSLGVAGLETNGGSCWNVKTVTMGSNTIKFKLRICFDEVVMRADLDRSSQSPCGREILFEECFKIYIPESGGLLY